MRPAFSRCLVFASALAHCRGACVTLSCSRGPLSPEMCTCVLPPRTPPSCIDNAAVASRRADTAAILHVGSCAPSCVATGAASKAALSSSSGSLLPAKLTCGQPCTLPRGIDNAATAPCGSGSRAMPHNGTWALSCVATCTASEAIVSCGSGALSPAIFTCEGPHRTLPGGIDNTAVESCGAGA